MLGDLGAQLKSLHDLVREALLNQSMISNLSTSWDAFTAQNFSVSSQDSVSEKLAVHEKNVKEFDTFVETLQ